MGTGIVGAIAVGVAVWVHGGVRIAVALPMIQGRGYHGLHAVLDLIGRLQRLIGERQVDEVQQLARRRRWLLVEGRRRRAFNRRHADSKGTASGFGDDGGPLRATEGVRSVRRVLGPSTERCELHRRSRCALEQARCHDADDQYPIPRVSVPRMLPSVPPRGRVPPAAVTTTEFL